MAAKTITIDIVAYKALSNRKRANESFSQVIKRILREDRYSAKNLINNLNTTALSAKTLNAVEKQTSLLSTNANQKFSLDFLFET